LALGQLAFGKGSCFLFFGPSGMFINPWDGSIIVSYDKRLLIVLDSEYNYITHTELSYRQNKPKMSIDGTLYNTISSGVIEVYQWTPLQKSEESGK
jgi:hypothetical protein